GESGQPAVSWQLLVATYRCLKLWLKWASFFLPEKFEKKKHKLATIGDDFLAIAADQPFVFEIVLLKALILV
ncbi:hypothetical protein BDA96_09G255600, partial [Sorghum bicolor]